MVSFFFDLDHDFNARILLFIWSLYKSRQAKMRHFTQLFLKRRVNLA